MTNPTEHDHKKAAVHKPFTSSNKNSDAPKKPQAPTERRAPRYAPVQKILEDLFGALSDDELIVELSADPSLHRFASKTLEMLSPSGGYHQTILYYLKTRRPELLAHLDLEARRLAAAWPRNYLEIQKACLTGGWWTTALRKRFREELRIRMLHKNERDWLEMIWPVAVEILKHHEVPRRAGEMERAVAARLALPSTIYKDWKEVPRKGARGPARRQPVGENLWLPLRKLLRHRIIEHYGLLGSKA